MSDTPIPSKRKWTKPLMGAVPVFLLATWVYSALQFPRLPFSFLPKDVKMEVGTYQTFGTSLFSPVVEVSAWNWELPQLMPTKVYLDETKRYGFKEVNTYDGNFFQLQDLDHRELLITLLPEGYKDPMKQGIRLYCTHTETRPLYCLVKSLKAMYDRERRLTSSRRERRRP